MPNREEREQAEEEEDETRYQLRPTASHPAENATQTHSTQHANLDDVSTGLVGRASCWKGGYVWEG
jgi:hypothetical protein